MMLFNSSGDAHYSPLANASVGAGKNVFTFRPRQRLNTGRA
jgi:hypothetical protein